MLICNTKLYMQVRYLVLWMVVMMVILPSSAIVTASSNISLENCPQTCGNISVPYPFGFGRPECAKNDFFLLNCNQSALFFGDVQIYKISFEDSTITGGIWPAYKCYDQFSPPRQDSSLNIWPWTISPTENKLIGLGCDTVASLTDREGRLRSGCLAICNDPDDIERDSSCSGFGCCQTSIAKHLNTLNITASSLSNHSYVSNLNPCSYAYVVANSFNISEINFLGHPNETMTSTPAVLEWVIGDQDCQAREGPSGYSCGNNAYCYYSATVGGIRCSCNPGFTGNPYLLHGCQDIDECADPYNSPCSVGSICKNNIWSYACERKHAWPIIWGCLGFGVACLLIIGAWWSHKILKKRRKKKLQRQFFKQNGGLLLQQQLSSTRDNIDKTKIFSIKELERATDHFNRNRILGQGGQGTVYKGMLVDGRIIAVKKSKVLDKAKVKEFINEMVILMQTNHRNIVKLLGCCLETEVPLLVYEFILNGTLFQYIHDENEDFPLTWERCLTIAVEVASALSYLHSAASVAIYHRDVKSSNILLDEKYRAKVSDFGTSRSIAIDQTHLTTNVKGTFGYLDPEYFRSSQFTEKSDVYSFGVVLVELLTGKKPIFLTGAEEEETRGLADYFILSMEENNLFNILDPQVRQSSAIEEITKVAKLAYQCLSLSGKSRPKMIEVAMELEQIRLSQNKSNGQQNHEQTSSYVKVEVTNQWDGATGTSSLDMEPLFSSESRGSLEMQVISNTT